MGDGPEPWLAQPALRVPLHSDHCPTCLDYGNHLALSMREDEPSLQEAFSILRGQNQELKEQLESALARLGAEAWTCDRLQISNTGMRADIERYRQQVQDLQEDLKDARRDASEAQRDSDRSRKDLVDCR